LFAGANSNPDRLLVKQARGITFTGLAVASAGDFNGDGYGDILFSGRSQGNRNIIYIIFGKREKLGILSLDDLNKDIGFSVSSASLASAESKVHL
jgi:hypothetical protein